MRLQGECIGAIQFSMALNDGNVAAWRALWILGGLGFALAGCLSPRERAELLEQIDVLERAQRRLERNVAERDAAIARLRVQIENLQDFNPDRPVDLFAPVRVEIASLSGGEDYDGAPGDDGVTVYLRPRDEDGNVVKVPGRITVQLLDTSQPGSPRVLGVCVFEKPEELRRRWHGRFWTDHYTLPCPFSADADLRDIRTATVHATFVDYLTGKTLTAVKDVPIAPGDE